MTSLPLSGKVTYRINNIVFDKIDINILHAKFKDGRIMGLLAEHLIDNVYRNATRSSDEGTPWDIHLRDGNRIFTYQCKVANCKTPSAKFDLKPSRMKGVGRKYDRQQMEEHLCQIDGFILVELSQFPVLTIWTMPVACIHDSVTDIGCSVKVDSCDERAERGKALLRRVSTTLVTQAR